MDIEEKLSPEQEKDRLLLIAELEEEEEKEAKVFYDKEEIIENKEEIIENKEENEYLSKRDSNNYDFLGGAFVVGI